LGSDQCQVRGAGGAIHQRDAIEKEAGGKRPDEEVLECRLRRGGVRPVIAGENVDRYRHHFETKKENDQVFGTGQEHHACGGQQDEWIVLRGEQMLALHVAEREENGGTGCNQDERRRRIAVRIQCNHLGQTHRRDLVHPERRQARTTHHYSGDTDPAGKAAVSHGLVSPADNQQHEQGPTGEQHLRKQPHHNIEWVGHVQLHQRLSSITGPTPTLAVFGASRYI
jgi:hypothetical protein